MNILIEVHAVQLVIGCLGCFELSDSIEAVTVDAADQGLTGLFIPHLILSLAVSHHGSHGTKVLFVFRDIDDRCHVNHPARCGGLPHR